MSQITGFCYFESHLINVMAGVENAFMHLMDEFKKYKVEFKLHVMKLYDNLIRKLMRFEGEAMEEAVSD
jgi:hypothetical protein